ncbi:MAG: MATE family efflux transporter [Prevotella sp.]|nr:MATE family efflux transporter [Prevotella sp.]
MKPIDHQILKLALPSIVSNITVPLLGLCDVTIMGHIGGATHIGAIAVGSMIFNVMYWLFGFLRMGTSGLTSQALGSRQFKEVSAMLYRSLLVALVSGVVIVLLQWPLQQFTFFLMQPTDNVLSLCIPYYYICIWGAPAVLGLYALTGWYIGMQNTRIPMLIAIGQNVVNIGISLLLVVGLGMKVEGVALGTVIAQWVGFLASLLLLRCYYGRLFHRHIIHWTEIRRGLERFFRLNTDIFLRTVCLIAVNLYFTSAGASQGALILAANTLLLQFFMFFSFAMDGFAFAGEALSGKYFGAHNRIMLRQTIICTFRWGVIVASMFTLVYWLGGTSFLSLLTTDSKVIYAAAEYLPWAILIPFCGLAAFVWDGIFIGITATRGMLLSCFVATLAFFCVYFLLRPTYVNHALWLAFLIYLLLRGIVQTIIRYNHNNS